MRQKKSRLKSESGANTARSQRKKTRYWGGERDIDWLYDRPATAFQGRGGRLVSLQGTQDADGAHWGRGDGNSRLARKRKRRRTEQNRDQEEGKAFYCFISRNEKRAHGVRRKKGVPDYESAKKNGTFSREGEGLLLSVKQVLVKEDDYYVMG